LPPLPELAKERFQAPVPAYYCNLQLGASMEPAVRAAAASCSSYPSLHPPRALVARRLGRSSGLSLPARRVAVAAAAIALDPFQETKTEQNDTSETEVFACPVCYEPLIRKGPPGMNLPAIYRSGFKCSKCNKSFTSKDVFLDLTVTSGMKEYSELKPARTELFRSPLVSYLYERGWRQNFNRSGFPGRDEEFQMAQDYFQSVAGGILVDVSCGSGLFSRKFASSGAYSSVIALDFSENMLRQCYDYIKQEETPMNTNLALVRADISRLPFASCSIDAIHAGAAIHCWPSPSNAIAEISRVLKPGGVFVATTFLSTPTNSGLFSIDALKPLRQIVGPVNSSYNFFTEGELEDLCRSCGLVNYSSKVQRVQTEFLSREDQEG
uniref:Methyltransferase type 11 domain-containing protein n=1 Tax=Aegilops tauschii subsp. strangulata TaxID=200361 RepID=A0A453T4C5_AEGTS